MVAIYSAGREKGLPYLDMPFHAGGTLEQWLQRTPCLATIAVARIGIQLAKVLVATHAKGVLHRDIKPSDVLLEGGLDRVRLADFGLAQPVEDNASYEKQFVAGTPHYMSPEQARGESIDARSDLFGLGALPYQLATGHTIYEGNSAKHLLQAATLGETKRVRELNPKLSLALADIIERLLAPRPDNRSASVESAAKALVDFANRAGRYWRWTRRAATGFSPVLVATNDAQPMMLVDAPLTLEELRGRRHTRVRNRNPCLNGGTQQV